MRFSAFVTFFTALIVAVYACPASLALAQENPQEENALHENGEIRAEQQASQPEAPQLIVAISVDQFSADLFAQYRSHYEHGLKRLLKGAVFPSGYQSHAATETCPGHSTILTGAHPARTGIIANRWFDLSAAREDKRIYCAEDEGVEGSNSGDYTASPVHLLVPTLGERMKAANSKALNIAVAGKDRAAIMMGGRTTDQIYFWTGKGFGTLAGGTLSAAAERSNERLTQQLAAPRVGSDIPAYCEARNRAVRVSDEQTVGQWNFARPAGETTMFRYSPDFDTAVLDLASALLGDAELGRDDVTDVLSVGLSATDYIGHGFGTEGLEMCIQMASLDAALGEFFDTLDATGIDYAVVLTADHGGHDLPERLRMQAMPDETRANPALAPTALGAAIAAELGLDEDARILYGDGPFGDMYISRDLAENEREAVFVATRQRLEAHPQVAAVFSKEELAEMPMPSGPVEGWTLAERARVSFHPERSGDFVVLLKRGVTPISEPGTGYVATHGSPWDYDRRVPILFWRKGMVGFEQPAPVETVDIAPTLAAIAGLATEEGAFDGRCLDLDAGAASTCK